MASAAVSPTPSHLRHCGECDNDMPVSRLTCPHCGRPQFFPNVDLAKIEPESRKLSEAHARARDDCDKRGCLARFDEFEAICAESSALFNCSLQKLHREVGTGTDLFENYQDLERLRLRTTAPDGFDWAKLRPQAEIELLGSEAHLNQLHYACLSIDGNGLVRYGECSVELAGSMIAHRASCFGGNTAIVFFENHSFSASLRCAWNSRGVICASVFGGEIEESTAKTDYPGIIVVNAPQPQDDRFIEVHVFGPITTRTFKAVRIKNGSYSRREKVLCAAVAQKLRGARIDVQISS